MAKGIPIPSDWTETDGYSLVSFCIPYSSEWRAIIVGMVENLSYGRFWSRDSGTITDVQVTGREVFETMSICKLDEILAALQSIATSLSVNTSACGCTNGPGVITANGDIFYGSEAPLSEPTSYGQPGDEFATRAEYLAFKCKVANAIVSTLVETLSSMSALSLALLTGGSVIVGVSILVGLITVPPIAILIALVLTGLGFGAFADLATKIDDRRGELVCGLYTSFDAQEAYELIRTAIEDEAGVLGWVANQVGLISDFLMQLVPIDAMNKLFALLSLPSGYTGEVDCASCGCVIQWSWPTDAQGFVFTDKSPPGTGSATGIWTATGLRVDLVITSGGNSAIGEWALDVSALGLTTTVGDKIAVSVGTSPEVIGLVVGGIIATVEESSNLPGAGARVVEHEFVSAGTLDEIFWRGQNGSGSGPLTNDVTAFTLTLELQNATPCPPP